MLLIYQKEMGPLGMKRESIGFCLRRVELGSRFSTVQTGINLLVFIKSLFNNPNDGFVLCPKHKPRVPVS